MNTRLLAIGMLSAMSIMLMPLVTPTLAQNSPNLTNRPVRAQPQIDPYTQMVQQEEAREAEQQRTMAGGYEACLQAAQYMSSLERIQAAHIQSCQCLLQGQQGVVSPAGDFMGCDPQSFLPPNSAYTRLVS